MQKSNPQKKNFQEQSQQHPGMEYKMHPLPKFDNDSMGEK